MKLARIYLALSMCVGVTATAAACSGSFGSGTGMPATMASPNFGVADTPSPVPSTAAAILTYGSEASFQSIPEVRGYAAQIAFPPAPSPTAAAASKGKKDAAPAEAPTPVAIAVGASLWAVKPEDGPDLNFVSGKGKHRRTREKPARALAYIELLPTHDATLPSYPRIAIDIPREVASQYRDGEFGLALWNAGEKDSRYRLAVAELDKSATPPPGSYQVKAVAKAPPSAPPTLRPGASPSPGIGPTLATVTPSAAPTLPPEHLVFAPTAETLKLVANRPAIFALYALPHPAASPAPVAAGSAAPGSPQPSSSAAAAPGSGKTP